MQRKKTKKISNYNNKATDMSFVESITWPVFKLGTIHTNTRFSVSFYALDFLALSWRVYYSCTAIEFHLSDCLLWQGIKQNDDNSKTFKNRHQIIVVFYILLWWSSYDVWENIHQNLKTFRHSCFSYGLIKRVDFILFFILTVKMETTENATDITSLMTPSEAITWCVIFSLEALVALATNAVAIIVFLQNTWIRKQTSILLLNLAVADLLVSLIAIPGWVYIIGSWANLWRNTSTNLTVHILYSSLDIAGAFASVTNHGCIAVERLIATVMPFAYRSRKKKITAQSVTVVWTCALVIPALTLVGFHVFRSSMFAFFVWMPFLSVLLLVIATSYLILLCRVKMVSRDLRQESDCKRNHRFTVTALIVCVVSLMAWLPFMIMSAINLVVPINQDLRRVNIVKVLHYFNSLCSLLVYWFRIPRFKEAACALVFCHKRRRQLPQAAMTARSSSSLRSVVAVSSSL